MERRFLERKREILAQCEVPAGYLADALQRLQEFVAPFARLLNTTEQHQQLADYVAGLCSSVERKTSETIAYFHQQGRQPLQRFIGWHKWDHRPLLEELARQVGRELAAADAVLVLDPSAFSKKGERSVGVQRQWNGRVGKVDNCQVGVYLGYVSRQEQALVDVRLYLPRSWTGNRSRRRECHIPEEVVFLTKLEQALEMIIAHRQQLPHAWVAGDDEFGRSTGFRRELRALNERYLLAVPSDTLVRDLDQVPPAWRGFGKHPKADFQRVDAWCAHRPLESWTPVDVRDGDKGPLLVHVCQARVLAITERGHDEREELLVVTRRIDERGGVIDDYWLSNAPFDTPAAELARVAKARTWIEECFQRAKGEAGLADYETRSWQGWHHHQTLSLLASWYLLQEQRRWGKKDAGTDAAAGANRRCLSVVGVDRGTDDRAFRERDRVPTETQRARPVLPLETPQPPPTLTHSSTQVT
ncbi:hypothetical protein Pan44_20840 [Caulifigura coniformis]|uniref:Transposase IS701-like DDE domain-containing protein n=1 Tax=Caulifigura coniformis TaxID=2527983 RepID=A0A517SD66_9PLAN|nr:IS701 family transposase [Caulifigura coniformis]QDT54057.1 hypothetical protein Pan44_20840 [Caulifigura coniformis]